MTNRSGDGGQDKGALRLSDEAQKRLNVRARARARVQTISDEFRAYGTKIGARNGLVTTAVKLRVSLMFCHNGQDLVETHLQEYNHPPADAWPLIAGTVLRRIKNAVSDEPPLPKMLHTYPWRPSELFGRQDFVEAMLAMIRSHFPQSDAEPIKAEQSTAIPNANEGIDYSQARSMALDPAKSAEPISAPQNNPARGKPSQPTPEQMAIVEKWVAEQQDVDTRTGACWLRCTSQHILRLVRENKLVASSTRPKRITTQSLRAHKWRKRSDPQRKLARET